jgi:RNA-directed DNA polymerase
MSGPRQNTQRKLARAPGERGEAPIAGDLGAEPVMAVTEPERPAATTHLIEEVCERENLVRAWQRVRENKGAPGVDGMTIDDAKSYLREHWPDIRSQLLAGAYQPQPVKRVEIPKPEGGVRKLGVPCVVDRLIQQALLQALQKKSGGTRRSPSTATASVRDGPRIRRWPKHNGMSPKATTSWSISTSKNFPDYV